MPTDAELLRDNFFRVIEQAIATIGLREVLRLCEKACLRQSSNITEHTSGSGTHSAANWNTAASRCVANIDLYPVEFGKH